MKSGAVTTSATVVVCCQATANAGDTEGIRTCWRVGQSVVTERVDVEVAGLGLKVPLAPVGSPLTLNVTWPVKPFIGLTVTL